MTLIKIYFVNSLRILTTDVQSRLTERVRYEHMFSRSGFLQLVSGRLLYRVDPSCIFEVCICIGSGVSIALRNGATGIVVSRRASQSSS